MNVFKIQKEIGNAFLSHLPPISIFFYPPASANIIQLTCCISLYVRYSYTYPFNHLKHHIWKKKLSICVGMMVFYLLLNKVLYTFRINCIYIRGGSILYFERLKMAKYMYMQYNPFILRGCICIFDEDIKWPKYLREFAEAGVLICTYMW